MQSRKSVGVWAGGMVALCATSACQMLSGVDDLQFAADASAPTAGSGGTAGAAGTGGASGSPSGGGGAGGALGGAGGSSGGSAGSGGPGCNPEEAFGNPEKIPVINDGTAVRPWLSEDQTKLYFSKMVGDNYELHRATLDAAGKPGAVTPLQAMNSGKADVGPTVTANGSVLFFGSDRLTAGKVMLYRAALGTSGDFELPELLPGVNDNSPLVTDGLPSVTGDGELLYWRRGPTTLETAEIYAANLVNFEAHAATALNVGKYNSFPTVRSDGLTIYFASDRPGGPVADGIDIWVARRKSRGEEFEAAEQAVGVNSIFNEFPGWISPDDCTLYLHRAEGGSNYILVARRPLP
jgi:hypothetical protein